MSEAHIKKILGQLDDPYDPKSWSVLSSKLNSLTDPAAVGDVDRAIYTTLSKLTIDQQPTYWGQLSLSLTQIQARQQIIYWMKTIECLLIAALVWGFAAIDPEGGQPKPNDLQTASSARMLAATSNHGAHSGVSLSTPDERATPSIQATKLIRAVSAPSSLVADVASDTLVAPSSNLDGELPLPLVPVEQIDPLQTPPLAEVISGPDKMGPTLPVSMQSNRSGSAYWGVGITGERGYFPNGLAADRFGAIGLSMYTGWRKASWQYEAGVNLGRYLLNTLPVEEFYAGDAQTGYIGKRLIGSRAIVAALPVQVHRRLFTVGNIRAAAIGGFSAHIALIRSDAYEPLRITPPQGSGPLVLPGAGKPLHLTADKGLFQGGAIQDNIWMSAQLGLQLEYPLGLDRRIFLQQVFSRDLGAARLSPMPRNRNVFAATVGLQVGF